MSNGCVHSGYNAKNFTATNRALLNITIPTNAILCLTREQSSRTPVNSSNPQKQRRKKKQQQKKVFCFVSYQHGVTSMQCNATPLFFFSEFGSSLALPLPLARCAPTISHRLSVPAICQFPDGQSPNLQERQHTRNCTLKLLSNSWRLAGQ